MTQNTPLTKLSAALGKNADAAVLYDEFASWVLQTKGFALYEAQAEALTAVALDTNVILATPTGTGKSTVALGAHFMAYTRGERSVYTAPIKALVSEKFFELVAVFGAPNVGMITGDVTINPDAPVLCATAEIVAQFALSDPNCKNITQIIMDEFHFYADPERGWAWQVPLLTAHRAQFLLMSATLGDITDVMQTLHKNTGRDTVNVTGVTRPVPLNHRYQIEPVHKIIELALADSLAPIYLVHFSQAAATEQAAALTSINLLSKDEKKQISEALQGVKFVSGYGPTLKRLLLQGVGVHHAGLLPKYRRLIEQLAGAGLLKVICGTDTLGVGINVPIRTVIMTGLVKFDGIRERRLTAREYHQIAGRAGRAGFDSAGDVIVAAPEHEIANALAAAKAAAKQAQSKNGKIKAPKKVAPKSGVTYSVQTFERLIAAEPETLTSRMRVSYPIVLAFMSRSETRSGELLSAGRDLIESSHESKKSQHRLKLEALEIIRSLRNSGLLEVVVKDNQKLLRLTTGHDTGTGLNSALSLFGVAALELLDPESESYALDAVSIIESTLENPRAVLTAQQKKLKTELLGQLKSEGVEYEERMRLLDEVSYPQPLAELISAAHEKYASATPTARTSEPLPKSIVRDMVENVFSFKDFINHYGLLRAEGTLLRYLTDAYRALLRTIPEQKKNDELKDIINWLGETVKQVDSSLLDEWARLAEISGDSSSVAPVQDELQPPGSGASGLLTDNHRAFTRMVRAAVFQVVVAAAYDQVARLVELSAPALQSGTGAAAKPMGRHDWDTALDDYYHEYDFIDTDAAARSSKMCLITEHSDFWQIEQIILDPSGDNAWAVYAQCDLAVSNELGEPAITVTDFRQR